MDMIYKYILDLEHEQILNMPDGAKFLSAQAQKGKICVWAIVDPDELPVEYTFNVYGTGHPLPEDLVKKIEKCGSGCFIDTVQMSGLVLHVFVHWK